jgi:hypothetical protein
VCFIKGTTLCKSCYDKERRKSTEYKDKRNSNNREWQKTYKAVVKLARDKNIVFMLTEEQWKEKTKNCEYCGDSLQNKTGIKLDRVDNTKGYLIDNTVGCCRQCNVAKNNYTLDEFKSWIYKVFNKMKEIDLTKVVEETDNTALTEQLACSGNNCEI